MEALLILLLFAQSPHETNPVKIVIGTGIGLYQKVISPSQGDVCNFSPSCSHFTKQSIEEYGPLWGSLMGADRLMRCNAFSHQYLFTYYSKIKDRKIYDPVEYNFIFVKKQIDTSRGTNESE